MTAASLRQRSGRSWRGEQVKQSDFHEAIRRERQEARAAARAFVQACQDADLRAFGFAAEALFESVGGWRLACKAVARLEKIEPAIRRAFLEVWTETKSLPLTIGDDRVTRDAIRILLPPYTGKQPVRLFRGTTFRERRRRTYGFSWSEDRATAERFAENHAHVAAELKRMQLGHDPLNLEAVLLETLAPPSAIICAPRHYDEKEYLVDRRRLNVVTVARRWRAQP